MSADAVPAAPRAAAAERFLLRLARELHEAGSPSHRTEEAMARLAPRLGVEGRFFSTPTSIFVSFGPEADSRTTLLRVEPAGVNLERMREVDEVITAVESGALDPAAASARLDRLAATPERYGAALTVVAFALAAATVARFLGGGVREILAAALVGAQTGVCALLAARRRDAARVFEWIASFAAAAAATGWALAFGPLVPAMAAVAGLIVLLPGLTLTVALTELATRHLVSGTARLAGAGLTFLAIGFGLALGARLAPLVGPAAVAVPLEPLPAWTEFLALALSPIALTVLFRARPGDVFVIAGAGFLAYGVQKAGAPVAGPEVAMLAAAFAAGVAGNLYARFARRPAAIPVVPALILLVPGSLGVRSVAALVDRAVVSGVEVLVTLFVLAGALAAGILLANFVVTPRRSL
jgi:uncharacterized membrane protein YjjP (DUF1212 family)